MPRVLGALGELGERVALALDEAATERSLAIEQARRGFMRQQLAGSRAARAVSVRSRWVLGAGVAAFAVSALVFIAQQRSGALTFKVDGALGVPKTWLAAPQAAPLALRFSEGTEVRLEAAARARVVDVDAHGASLALESGRLHADVVHKQDSVWRVVAGPFTVNVRGTVFDVNWDPSTERLRVSVSRGVVAVRESSTGAEQEVRASETLSTTSSQHHFDLTKTGGKATEPTPTAVGSAPASEAQLPEPPAQVTDLRDSPTTSPDERVRVSQARPEPTLAKWQEFAKRGAVREAFASAEASGFSAICASASPAELLSLGDGARLSGNSEEANLALLTLRRRYPSDSRRGAAAFSLGKVAFDQRRAYEQAAEWFSTSIREQPGGPLAREASGRLIEALARAGDTAGARRAARDYLKKYPDGPHADLARSVLR